MDINQKTLKAHYSSISYEQLLKLYKEYNDLTGIARTALLMEIEKRDLIKKTKEKNESLFDSNNQKVNRDSIQKRFQFIKTISKVSSPIALSLLSTMNKFSTIVTKKLYAFFTPDNQKFDLQYFIAKVFLVLGVLLFGMFLLLIFTTTGYSPSSASAGALAGVLLLMAIISIGLIFCSFVLFLFG